ncbi:glycoside hydrolase family 73 protein [Enterococcus sp. LJL90]
MARKVRRSGQNLTLEKIIMTIFLLSVVGAAFLYSIFSLATSAPETVSEDPVELSHTEFITTLVPHAQELQNQYGILPSIILGQAILESDWGQSSLASEYHNLFGIKASEGESSVTLETMEFVNEEWITIQGDFRVYNDWNESLDDHTQLFVNGVSWNPSLYTEVLAAQTYQEAAAALQTAGYATDPDYAAKIIAVIEENQLNLYDQT